MRKRTKKSAGRFLFKSCFVLCLLCGVFALVWLRAAVTNLEYELGQLEREKVESIRYGKAITAERAKLCSVKRVEEVALKKLGMTLPEREKVFLVKRSRDVVPYAVAMKRNPDRLNK
ncbi:MAG: cell division protein FtsL [Nitrospirae bacterium]|nr:cell division protein FtsL [Nitrospirota bacterium]